MHRALHQRAGREAAAGGSLPDDLYNLCEMPSVAHFNKVLKYCALDSGNYLQAQRVMDLMTRAHTSAGKACFTTALLLLYYCFTAALLPPYYCISFSPDLITYNTLLDVLAKSAHRRGHAAFLQGLQVKHALLLLYNCFPIALLLIYYCYYCLTTVFTSLTRTAAAGAGAHVFSSRGA